MIRELKKSKQRTEADRAALREAVSEIIRNGRRNWLAIFVDGDACPISQTYYERVKREYMQIKPK